jgi:hypothetical protein
MAGYFPDNPRKVKDELVSAHAIKARGAVEVKLHLFVTSVLNGVVSCTALPSVKVLPYPLITSPGEAQSQVGCCGQRDKIPYLYWESNHDSSDLQTLV